jgi:hypothetical protein
MMKSVRTELFARVNGIVIWMVAAGILGATLVTGNGCSVYMASKQPDKKDLNIFSIGTPRTLVLAEIGQPLQSEIRDGKRVDVFTFLQGYSKGAKAGRAVWHGVADVFTAGLWEVVGTPTEYIFDGDKVAYEVTYDTNDRVEKVVTRIGDKVETTPRQVQDTTADPPKDRKVEPKTEPAKIPPVKTAYTADSSKGVYKGYTGEHPENEIATLEIGAGYAVIIDDMHYVSREKYGSVKLVAGDHRIKFGPGLISNINFEAGHAYKISSYKPSGLNSKYMYWIEDMTTGKIIWEENKP